MNFAERLKELRLNRDMNQKELAELINLKPSAVSKYEKGMTQPGIDTIITLADIFNVSTDYLLGKSDIRNPYTTDSVTPKEFNLIARFRKLSNENKIRIDERINTMLDGKK